MSDLTKIQTSRLKTEEVLNSSSNPIITSEGGTIDGILTMGGDVIKNKNNTSWISIFGGTSVDGGAGLELIGHSRDHSNKGGFDLRAKSVDGTPHRLIGKPDGTLTWDGNSLLTTGNLKTINNNSLVGSGNISIASSPISALCTTKATTSSTASSTKPAVIIQNYKSGTNWYRVWSDGWIEQGGTSNQTYDQTFTFLKAFSQTPSIYLGSLGGEGVPRSLEYSTTKIRIQPAGDSAKVCWYACGY